MYVHTYIHASTYIHAQVVEVLLCPVSSQAANYAFDVTPARLVYFYARIERFMYLRAKINIYAYTYALYIHI